MTIQLNNTELIEEIKKQYENLSDKRISYTAFYSGFLAGYFHLSSETFNSFAIKQLTPLQITKCQILWELQIKVKPLPRTERKKEMVLLSKKYNVALSTVQDYLYNVLK